MKEVLINTHILHYFLHVKHVYTYHLYYYRVTYNVLIIIVS